MVTFLLHPNVVVWLARLLEATGHAVYLPEVLGMATTSDPLKLLRATELKSVFVTHNLEDVVLMHDAWQQWSRAWGVNRPHGGILVIPQFPHWTAEQSAAAIDQLSRSGVKMENELLVWSRAENRWLRRRLDGGWEPALKPTARRPD